MDFFWFGVRAQKTSGRQNPTRIYYFSQRLFIGLEAEFHFTGQFKNSLVLGNLRSLQIPPPKFTDLPTKGNFPPSPRAPWPYSVVTEETLGWEQQRVLPAQSQRSHQDPPAQTQVLRRGSHPTSLTEHTERDGCRHVAAIAAPDPALESAGVLTADLGEAQRRVRALLQPLAVPVPGIEGLLGCTQSPQAGQGDGRPFLHLRRGLDQDLCGWRRDGRGISRKEGKPLPQNHPSPTSSG